jgi:hypothetical protein
MRRFLSSNSLMLKRIYTEDKLPETESKSNLLSPQVQDKSCNKIHPINKDIIFKPLAVV